MSIFDANDHLDMAHAAQRLGSLSFASAKLTDLAYRIGTLDDMYFSRLNGRAYMAWRGSESPSRILELAKLHDGFAVERPHRLSGLPDNVIDADMSLQLYLR